VLNLNNFSVVPSILYKNILFQWIEDKLTEMVEAKTSEQLGKGWGKIHVTHIFFLVAGEMTS
jgi:hypothetical protein